MKKIDDLRYDIEAALEGIKQTSTLIADQAFGQPHSFDKDKWQWEDTKRINEQEKRITHCEETLANLKKEVDTLIQSMLSLGPTRKALENRWDLTEYAKKSLMPPKLHQAEYWVKEEYHQD
jgi:predicted RNase H-like nuclease (RuvC/YqgF family)